RVEIDSRSAELQALRSSRPTGDPQVARLESEFAQLQATYSDSLRTFENLRIAEARGLNTLTVVEPAVAPADPVRPSKPQTVALAVLAGLVVAAATARILEYLDDGVRNRERLAAATGLRALGSIPNWPAAKDHSLASLASEGPSAREAKRAAEGYRLLFSTLSIATAEMGADDEPRAIMITSAAGNEGKSLTAANVAAVFAEAGRRVILVDADVHRPSQMRRFDISNRAGLSTLLVNPNASADSLVRETAVPGLRLLPAGPAPAAPSALYTSRRLEDRLSELREQCDVLVLDTPPVLGQPDAALLAPHVDGVVLVVDVRTSRGRQVRRALELLNAAGAQVWGAALNRVPVGALDYIQYQGYATEQEPAEESAGSASAVRPARRGAS
ncbi:MAG: polysaccharide biosynthesis tyrosine autokinase, partial [Chloroflexota bacterium]|nr:polysaccharide biosynthesis tyrosine autokinase [Chloroflexota bacterium]